MAIAVVQSVLASGSGVSSITTANIATTTGNLVIVDCSYFSGSFVSQTDSGSHTWTNSIAEAGVSEKGRQNYNASITGSASHNFTLTISGAGYPNIVAKEVSGAAASPLDKTASGTETPADGIADSPDTSTTAQADELLSGIGWIDNPVAQTLSVNSPWTLDQTQPWTGGNSSLISASRVVAATGTYHFTFTSSVNNQASVIAISTWKAAAGGGGINVTATTGIETWGGRTATLGLATNVAGTIGVETWNGKTASITTGNGVAATTGVETWNGRQANINSAINITTTTGVETWNGRTAGIGISINVGGTIGTETWNGRTATVNVSGPTSITIGLSTEFWNGYAATVTPGGGAGVRRNRVFGSKKHVTYKPN